MIIHDHFKVNEKNHLEIAGVDATYLVNKYGTPLFVYDIERVRKNARDYLDAFKRENVSAQVAYASKAFSSVAILEVMKQEGMSLDIVSEGELYTAMKAGFPPEKIHFHGNNKSEKELEYAVEIGIGCIIIDNFYEIELLRRILVEKQKKMDVLFRITPGIESETHKFIMTGNEDSKFGFNLANGQADEAFRKVYQDSNIRLKGVHSHIGSQIFSEVSFKKAAELLFKLVAQWNEEAGFIPEVMNFGGGFGIKYTEDDQPIEAAKYVQSLINETKKQSERLNIPLPEIWIEPGRSIVGDAGVSLYEIGSRKDIPGIRSYVSVDGGMHDNIRPALYKAGYEAVVANRVRAENEEEVSIAGKCCESGDMLIWDIALPKLKAKDILAVFSTGAYGYSMASNYNRFPKPAVVFVENGIDQLVIRRESNEDILRNDLSYLKD